MSANSEVSILAETVADMLCPRGRVDPVAIAREVGLTHSVGRYGDTFDALLEFQKSRFHVYLNKERGNDQDAPRGRFSFGHELGHFFIDEHRWALSGRVSPHGSLTGFCSNNAAEREADSFAAYLLMPSRRLKNSARGRRGTAETIEYLAGEFGTSYSATAIHCARNDVFPMIVMLWTVEGCAWCWSSSEYQALTRNRARRRIDEIPSDSVTRRVLQTTFKTEGESSERGTTLGTWFASIPMWSPRNEILIEECIALGRFGALTILRPDGG